MAVMNYYTPVPFKTNNKSFLGQINNSSKTNTPPNTDSFVTPKSTVQDQLNTLLKQNSDYVTLNRNQAMEQANKAGMSGSTMAAGAGQQAAIKSALDIARPDAQTYATSALEGEKSFLTNESNKEIAKQNYILNQAKSFNDWNNQQSTNQTNLYGQKLQIKAQKQTQAASEKSAATSNYNARVAEIQANPNYTAKQKEMLINNLNSWYNYQVNQIDKDLGFSNVKTSWNNSGPSVPTPSNTYNPSQDMSKFNFSSILK